MTLKDMLVRLGYGITSVVRAITPNPSVMYSTTQRISSQSQSSLHGEKYQEAIRALNGLQSPQASSKEVAEKMKQFPNYQQRNIVNTNKYATRCGIDVRRLEERYIHVTGTKGKGSTCALTESILRHHGYTTGFFSSPHLFSVTERLRINGKPISEEAFSKYFWHVYHLLYNNREHEHDMPTYFHFLCIMAFHVFIEEDVDVTIFEVGIGGEYDSTNIVKKTAVVGITSIGLDHTSILGDTVESIAWMKGGIMKEGCLAFTCDDQPPSAMQVLHHRAQEKNCKLHCVSRSLECSESLDDPVHELNASLAVRLAHAWMYKKNATLPSSPELFRWESGFSLPKETMEGITRCIWPGRFHKLTREKVTYYLDGAHTLESINYCATWFHNHIKQLNVGERLVLVFNVTKQRSPDALLERLSELPFSLAIFCPNVLSDTLPIPQDLVSVCKKEGNMELCEKIANVWRQLSNSECQVIPNVQAVCQLLATGPPSHSLVTGSLHLVGNFLRLLEPHLWDL